MTPLQQRLTKKIQAVCPELLELSLGCEVKLNKNINGRKKGDVGIYAGSPDEDIIFFGNHFITSLGEDNFEILGHPIRLEHIMKALISSKKKNLLSPELKSPSEFYEIKLLIDMWDFNKPLFDQPLSVQEWIDSVI